jgi:hypothetical protein
MKFSFLFIHDFVIKKYEKIFSIISSSCQTTAAAAAGYNNWVRKVVVKK